MPTEQRYGSANQQLHIAPVISFLLLFISVKAVTTFDPSSGPTNPTALPSPSPTIPNAIPTASPSPTQLTSPFHPAGNIVLGYITSSTFSAVSPNDDQTDDLCRLPYSFPQSQEVIATGVCLQIGLADWRMYNVTEISISGLMTVSVDMYASSDCVVSVNHMVNKQQLGCTRPHLNISHESTKWIGVDSGYTLYQWSYSAGDEFPSVEFSGANTANYPSAKNCQDSITRLKPYRFSVIPNNVCVTDDSTNTSYITSCAVGSGYRSVISFDLPGCRGTFTETQESLLSASICQVGDDPSAPNDADVTGCGADPFNYIYPSTLG